MQKIWFLLLAVIPMAAAAQHPLTILVKDKRTQAAIPGVSISAGKTGAITDQNGYTVLRSIPDGLLVITFSATGYTPMTDSFSFPRIKPDTVIIRMETEMEALEEVIVQSTRTSRTIKNTPARIETIDGEELDEKNNMRPANVAMLLHESTGLQVQQTSATSGNAGIRVQGLDGRYTQLLKDGYPNFGNFASGLSILEIPPLDLKQVEIIKGPASTLYGGGAIAGVVNFISKTPKPTFEGDFIINQSNIGQTNIGAYIAQQKGRLGYSFLGLLNLQQAYDVDKDDFSEVPESRNFTINPGLFYTINASTTLQLGNSFTKGINTGGDMQVIRGKGNPDHTYFEKNNTVRNITTLEVGKKMAGKNRITLKQSLSIFDRQIRLPGYSFAGVNTNSFTEGSFLFHSPGHTHIAGINIIADRFRQKDPGTLHASSVSAGGYYQDTWDVSARLNIESGLRIDYVHYRNNLFAEKQIFVLPRVSVLFKPTDKITSRISFGSGYKTPTVFTEQTERLQYRNLLALDGVRAEKSIGGTADVNYKTNLCDDLSFSINQLFFYTRIASPLVLQTDGGGNNFFVNAAKPFTSHGIETNLRFIFKDQVKLFAGYTYTNARAAYLPGKPLLPLLPKHKLNLTLMYEKEDNFKLGLEGYYTGRQYLYNGWPTPAYWEFGFMAQKTVKQFSVFINFENFTDQRQSRYKTVANPPHNNPSFDDIWNHTEGFVMNGGIKLKW